MKKFILGLAFILSGLVATAQDTLVYASGLRVQFGGAFPTGAFSSTDFEEEYPPFAVSGPLLQLSYYRSINEQFFAGATLGYRRNPFKLDEFADPDDELVISKASEPWQSVFTMADAEYRILSRNGYFYMKGSVGAAFSRSASLEVKTTHGTIIRRATNNFALAYGIGTGMQVSIQKFGIGYEAGILATTPTFEQTDTQGKTTRYKQAMATVNVGLFISYSF